MSKGSFIPRYQRIYEDLKRQIEDGAYGPGQRLPYERELCARYGVQRITVRRSLELLAERGLIEKHAGRGSFVRAGAAEGERAPSETILFLMRKNQNDIERNAQAFNAQLFFPMERICSEHGFTLVYTGLDEADDCESILARHGAAGAFLVSTLPEEAYRAVAGANVPALCINHRNEALFLCVMPDNEGGIRAAVDLLCGQGHERIAFICGMAGAVNAVERFDSFTMAMCRHGLTVRPEYVMHGAWTFDGGLTATAALLDALAPEQCPTAVVCSSDMMAIGCMEAIKKRGLSVPEDISVIGFDDIDMCKFCTPQLTSVRTDPGVMARIAFEHLHRLIARGGQGSDCYTIRLPVRLMERQSAAPPRAGASEPSSHSLLY